jgi:hypothetical protein
LEPHNFQALLTKSRIPSYFAGAGLSWGLVPGPAKLFSDRKALAEAELGVEADVPLDDPRGLYLWADAILAQLQAQGGPPPKLRLAKALGILEDPAWRGEVGFPVRGTSARHRVTARFAREELWQNVWTWNWDCVLERALEAVGFKRGAPARDQPWLTRYDTVVVQEDFPKLGYNYLFRVLKPHGCAHAIAEADAVWTAGENQKAAALAARFMIGWQELSQARNDATDTLFFQRMGSFLSTNPALIVGWSISEPYLSAVINDALANILVKEQIEELSVVDVTFQLGHQTAAECYGLTQEQVFFQLSPAEPGFTTDEFFLWLQARFCLQKMGESTNDEAIKARIALALNDIEPPAEAWLLDWADSFIPAWCRMCWRADVVVCAGFQAHQLELEAPEEHIPMALDHLIRPDLEAAARLFVMMSASPGWDLKSFPGALWKMDDLRLVVPLPAWSEINDLAGLKPWAADQQFGMVERIDVLPIHFDAAQLPISEETGSALRDKLCGVLNSPQFSNSENVGVVADLN